MQNKGEISFTNEQFFALIETNRKLTFKIEQLEQTLAQFKKLLFGAKHERVELINANQLPLGLNLGEQSPIETKIEEISFTRKKTKEKANPNRSPLPANLPREIIEINPLEDITGMKLIGYDITEQLEMTPAKFFVKQYRRAKYARTEGNGIAIGSLPDFALPKAIAGSSVLAHLLVSKYVDHRVLRMSSA